MSWGAMVWRTKRYGSWPGFDVEALQDGADVDDQALGEGPAIFLERLALSD